MRNSSIEHHTETGTTPYCDCCGRGHMRMTFRIEDQDNIINLGAICAGKWFSVNLTGNHSKAVKRLQNKLDALSEDDFESILSRIEASGRGSDNDA